MPKFRPADWLPWRWRMFGPILPYDIVTSSRRGRWYLLRIILTCVMFFVFWKSAEHFDSAAEWNGSREGAKSEFARSFYAAFASIQISAALLLAAAFLGGSIADERRRRILDFMFATDLTSREIILGKFVSRTFMIAALLAGSLPILACTMLFGGVSIDWILQLAMITATTLFCFGALSVLVSTTIAKPRDAVIRAMSLTIVLVVVPPILAEVARNYPGSYWSFFEPAIDEVSLLNPYAVLYHQMNTPSTGLEGYVWNRTIYTAMMQLIIGAVALFIAVLTVRRTIVVTAATTAKPPLLRSRFMRPELGNWSPIFWREAFGEPAVKARGKVGRMIAMLIFGLLNLGIFATWVYTTGQDFFGTPMVLFSMAPIACLVSILFVVMVGARAAGSVTSEKEADTWTTLIAGPIESDAIVSGKVKGALVNFRHLLVPFLLVWFLVGLSLPMDGLGRALGMFAVALLIAFVNANIGFYFSQRSKSTSAAVVKTVLTILFLGGGYIMPLALFSPGGPSELILVGAQFFLVSFPGFVQMNEHSNQGETAAAFALGCLLYSVVALILHTYNHSMFDVMTGRSVSSPIQHAPPKASSVQASGTTNLQAETSPENVL